MDRGWIDLNTLGRLGACALAIGTATGCQDASSKDPFMGGPGIVTSADTGSGETEDMAEPRLDLGSADGGSSTGSDACATVVEEADVALLPTDIVILVDNSTSMNAEAAFVQQEMNAFSAQISAANLDVHIVLISSYPGTANGLCIEPPLGSGGCPETDNNPPTFIHIDEIVEGASGLIQLLNNYPIFSTHLRPEATTHFVVVTDENAFLTREEFLAQWATTAAPEHSDFIFHGIISPEDPDQACATGSACCEYAYAHSFTYQELIAMTGGVEGDLCTQQFQPIFDALAQQVIGGTGLECSYLIPETQDGAPFDQDEVNIEFDDGIGGTLTLGRVDTEAGCAGVSGGWYYDQPADPQSIELCPQTCDEIQGFMNASISITFGCETIPAS